MIVTWKRTKLVQAKSKGSIQGIYKGLHAVAMLLIELVSSSLGLGAVACGEHSMEAPKAGTGKEQRIQ